MNPFLAFLQQIRSANQQKQQLTSQQQEGMQGISTANRLPIVRQTIPQSNFVHNLATYGGTSIPQAGQLATPQSLRMLQSFPQIAKQVDARILQPVHQMAQPSAGITSGQALGMISTTLQQPRQQTELPTTPQGQPSMPVTQPRPQRTETQNQRWTVPLASQNNQLSNTPAGGRNSVLPSGIIPSKTIQSPTTIPMQGATI